MNIEMTSHSFESDSGEQASTTDDVESSHQWTTDFEDGNSETGDEKDERNAISRIDSNYDDEDDDSDCNQIHGSRLHHYGVAVVRQSSLQNERKKVGKRAILDDLDKHQVQSDTETRNLLDDVGDFEDDYLDLQEAEATFNLEQQLLNNRPTVLDSALFELSEEQYDYYTKCFLYMLKKTQGHAQINGALNGADNRVIQFFRKSNLDDLTLSNIWALADVNEDGFLNLVEFIVAMHSIVLYLKGNLPIPARLSSPIRPPSTPTRHLVRLANGCYATLSGLNQTDELGSTTTTSADSFTSNSSFHQANNGSTGDNQSGSSNNSQKTQHYNYNTPNYVGLNTYKISACLPSNFKYENVGENKTVVVYDNRQNSLALDYADAAERINEADSANGFKQHSLSDDHLYLNAQRELAMAKFSDVPPLLVDSHPTALNATTSSTAGLAALESMTSSRGPPPQPPIRDYATNGGAAKGHGRSASLDLKTFSALSIYPPKSPHLHYCPYVQEHLGSVNQPSLATLNEDLSQLDLSQQKELKKLIKLRDQGTQTEAFEPVMLASFDYDEVFSIHDIGGELSSAERCKLLKKINDELESERVKLAQVRLQLLLRIEEAKKQLEISTLVNSGVKTNFNDQVKPIPFDATKPTAL